VIDRPLARSRCVLRRFCPLVVLCSLLAACGGSSAQRHAHKESVSPVERAPGDIVALATRSARATVDAARLPGGARPIAGSARLLAPPTLHNGAAFGDDYAYVSVVEWQQKWRVAASPALIVRDVASGLGAGATTMYREYKSPALSAQARALLAEHKPLPIPSPPSPTSIMAEAWTLPAAHRWFAGRALSVLVTPAGDGTTTVELAARVVWIPERLRIPLSARSAAVVLTPSGRVLARISRRRELHALALAVDALSPDEAVHGVTSCPALFGVPRELRLTFANAADRTVAVLSTEWCPADAKLSVAGYGSLLLSAGPGFVDQLERILGVHLAVSDL
jgi:hypothetical protein